MGIFRRRHEPEPEPELDKLLDGYSVTKRPTATHSGFETIICWRCHKPTMFDVRMPRPKSCTWCRAYV
jgi:hypothetical protein